MRRPLRRPLPALLLAAAALAPALAHRPGDEFSYLALFRPPRRPPAYSPAERAALAGEYLRAAPGRALLADDDPPDPQWGGDDAADTDEDGDPSDAAVLADADADADADAAVLADADADADAPPAPPPAPAPNQTDDDADQPAQDMAAVARRLGEDAPRLVAMVDKLLAQYDVRSLVDVPCRAHAHWMPALLARADARAAAHAEPPLRYLCVDASAAVLRELRARLAERDGARFVKMPFWRKELPPADLVLAWAGLENMRERHVVAFLRRLAESDHRLVMLGSHKGALEKEGRPEEVARFTMGGRPINLRKFPFSLTRPMRIVGNLSLDGNDKQLYVYKPPDMLRRT